MSGNKAAVLASAGLIGGFGAAQLTGVRNIGGAVLAAFGVATFVAAKRSAGTGKAILLGSIYTAAFGASHPLAKKMGAWPAVLTVTAVTAVAAKYLGRER